MVGAAKRGSRSTSRTNGYWQPGSGEPRKITSGSARPAAENRALIRSNSVFAPSAGLGGVLMRCTVLTPKPRALILPSPDCRRRGPWTTWTTWNARDHAALSASVLRRRWRGARFLPSTSGRLCAGWAARWGGCWPSRGRARRRRGRDDRGRGRGRLILRPGQAQPNGGPARREHEKRRRSDRCRQRALRSAWCRLGRANHVGGRRADAAEQPFGLGRVEPPVRVLAEQAAQHRPQRARVGGRRQLVGDDGGDARQRVRPFERWVTLDRGVQRGAEPPQIAGSARVTVAGTFGGDIRR